MLIGGMPYPANSTINPNWSDVAAQIDGTGRGTTSFSNTHWAGNGAASLSAGQINAPEWASSKLEYTGANRLSYNDTDWFLPYASGTSWEWFGLQADVINSTGGNVHTLLAQNRTGGQFGFNFYLYNGEAVMWLSTNGTDVTFGPVIPVTAGTTYAHIMWTWDGSFIRGYKDGAFVGKVAFSGPVYNSSDLFTMGAQRSGSTHINFFDGRYSAFRLTRTALLTSEETYSVPSLPLPTS